MPSTRVRKAENSAAWSSCLAAARRPTWRTRSPSARRASITALWASKVDWLRQALITKATSLGISTTSSTISELPPSDSMLRRGPLPLRMASDLRGGTWSMASEAAEALPPSVDITSWSTSMRSPPICATGEPPSTPAALASMAVGLEAPAACDTDVRSGGKPSALGATASEWSNSSSSYTSAPPCSSAISRLARSCMRAARCRFSSSGRTLRAASRSSRTFQVASLRWVMA
mmetsp:Transcript_1586/g.6347  ORF Transcript_1586/g.6347 Transcript_1586/m.6347 type:complete len:232 (+) Transcript_1586:1481-2176(+)